MTTRPLLETLDDLTVLARDVDDDGLMACRLEAASEALLYYATQRGLVDSGEDTETALSDLLADLMHLTAACGLPAGTFARLVERATMHFEDEHRGGC